MQEKASSNRNPQMKASINKESTVKSRPLVKRASRFLSEDTFTSNI
jgi:hypothetical protein